MERPMALGERGCGETCTAEQGSVLELPRMQIRTGRIFLKKGNTWSLVCLGEIKNCNPDDRDLCLKTYAIVHRYTPQFTVPLVW